MFFQPLQHTPGAYLPSYSDIAATTLLAAGDPHRLDAVKTAADNIIKEKDKIIDRYTLVYM